MRRQYVPHARHGSLRSYLTAYILSLVLTAMAFIVALAATPSGTAAVTLITIFALVQISLHLTLFLGLHRASDEPFKLALFFYVLVILAILIGASVWILYQLNMRHMVG